MSSATRKWFFSLWISLIAAMQLVAAEVPVDQAWRAMPKYQHGNDLGPLLTIDHEAIRAMSSPELRAAFAARLAALLEAEGTTPAAKQYICLQLRQVGTAAEVPLLARLLIQPDSSEMARHALESIAGEVSLQALRDALEKLEGTLLAGVIQSLGTRRDEGSVPALIGLTASSDPTVAVSAVRALGSIGDPAATQALRGMVAAAGGAAPRDASAALLACATRLAEAGQVEPAREIYDQLSGPKQLAGIRRASLTALLGLEGERLPVTVLEWFGSEDAVRRQVAAAQLTILTDQQLEQLATRNDELPETARVALLELLAMRSGAQALPLVLKAAASDQPQLQRAAIRCLGLIADAGTIPMLIETLASGDELRPLAAQALTGMPRAQVGPTLLKALNDQPALRPAIVDILKKMVYYDAIDPLIGIAVSDDPAVYEVALDGLRGIADPDPTDVPRLLKLLERSAPGRHRDEVEKTLLIVCEKQPAGADRAAPVLKALSGVDLTQSALHLPLLGRLGGPQSLKIIDAALRSDDASLREAGVRGICNWPDASVAERLLALAGDSQNAAYQQRALRAYVRVITLPSDRGDDQTLGLLQSAMRLADKAEDRQLILTRASTIRTMAAVDWIAGYLDQPELAQTACESLVELAHHRFLRQPNMDRFKPLLQRVGQISQNPDVVDRANRYQLGL
jgi:HEAT repeat protein